MNIAVLIKQTPDTAARIKIAGDRKGIDFSDVKLVLNPYDEFAVEEALLIKEKQGGEVTVFALGPDKVVSAIRNALAMGADKAVHLRANADGFDSLAIARALAHELKDGGWDLILAGKQAVDDDNMQVGPMVAQLLGIPCVTVVTELELSEGKVTAEREIEGGTEVIDASLPVLITAQKDLNEPRYPALKGIMAAKKKPVETRDISLGEPNLTIDQLEYPPEMAGGKIIGQGAEAVPELVRLLSEEAKVI